MTKKNHDNNPLPSYFLGIHLLILLIPLLLYKLFHILRPNKIFFCFDSPIKRMYFDPSEDYMGYMFAGDYCVTAMHVHCNVSFKFLVICRFVYVLIITVIHYGIITQNIFEVFFLSKRNKDTERQSGYTME